MVKQERTKMTAEVPFMDAFVASACEVMKTMAVKDTVRRSIRRPPAKGFPCEIGAVIELSGSRIAAVGLGMERALASKIVGSILGRPEKELTLAEIRNDVREIVNMIAGGAKSRLSGTPWHFALSIPRDCSGEMFSASLFPRAATRLADLQIDGRRLTLIVGLSSGS